MMSRQETLRNSLLKRRPRRHRGRVYRLAVSDHEPADELGYISPDSYQDEDLNSDGPSELVLFLLNEPFGRRVTSPQRWNTKFPCFYSSADQETSIEEMRYYAQKRMFRNSININKLHYLLFSAKFQGIVLNIIPMTTKYPELTESTHNEYCHIVAEVAWDRKLDGLMAKSVRNENGSCFAIYNRDSLNPGEIVAAIVFRKEADIAAVEVDIEEAD